MLPLCIRPGCVKGVRHRRRKCCSRECARALRTAKMKELRAFWTYRARAVKFSVYLDRIVGQRVTREDLLAIFQEIDKRSRERTWRAMYQHMKRCAAALANGREAA